jgi:hypothetical protein
MRNYQPKLLARAPVVTASLRYLVLTTRKVMLLHSSFYIIATQNHFSTNGTSDERAFGQDNKDFRRENVKKGASSADSYLHPNNFEAQNAAFVCHYTLPHPSYGRQGRLSACLTARNSL